MVHPYKTNDLDFVSLAHSFLRKWLSKCVNIYQQQIQHIAIYKILTHSFCATDVNKLYELCDFHVVRVFIVHSH